MTTITESQTTQTARFDRSLENAVIQGWDELMPEPTSGLIHIEYQTGSDGTLECVTIWASTTRGYWKLICELWMRPLWSHAAGLRFCNDYHSANVAQALELVLERKSGLAKLPDQHGLIQINAPTGEQRREADRWMREGSNASMPLKQHVTA